MTRRSVEHPHDRVVRMVASDIDSVIARMRSEPLFMHPGSRETRNADLDKELGKRVRDELDRLGIGGTS